MEEETKKKNKTKQNEMMFESGGQEFTSVLYK